MERREFLRKAAAAGISIELGSVFSNAYATAGKTDEQGISKTSNKNQAIIKIIEDTKVKYPYSFVFGGDCGATENPTGDGIFLEILRQIEQLQPEPIFFANIGDFAGPGTSDRHEKYLKLVSKFKIPTVHLTGNHDLDDASGWENFHKIYGSENFQFAYGNTKFVAINSTEKTNGPRPQDLAYLENALKEDSHEAKIVLMHMPPNLNEHYTPRAGWGFKNNEQEFLNIVKKYKVKLVCCAHVIAYDRYVYDNICFIASGGLGWGLCEDFGYLWGNPPNRGAFYHFVKIDITESGQISGKVIRAFDGTNSYKAFEFNV